MSWQPIETAPETTPDGVATICGYRNEDGETVLAFDYKEDGVWQEHENLVQYADAVAPRSSEGFSVRLPPREAPYTHYMELPQLPHIGTRN